MSSKPEFIKSHLNLETRQHWLPRPSHATSSPRHSFRLWLKYIIRLYKIATIKHLNCYQMLITVGSLQKSRRHGNTMGDKRVVRYGRTWIIVTTVIYIYIHTHILFIYCISYKNIDKLLIGTWIIDGLTEYQVSTTYNTITNDFLSLHTISSLSLSACFSSSFVLSPACQKHRHICSPLTTTTANVYLTRKLPSSCLTYLQYCHHQIFICKGEDL